MIAPPMATPAPLLQPSWIPAVTPGSLLPETVRSCSREAEPP
jgi:hypothetical protein